MNVLILKGGDSPEREVSLRSALAVAAALRQAPHQVTEYDTKNGFDGMLPANADVVLPILHGVGGEDERIQEFLEHHKVAFLGADAVASRLCFNKLLFKKRMAASKILTPKYEAVTGNTFKEAKLAHNPFVLKPVEGGSSIDTYIIRSLQDLDAIPKDIFDRYPQMLLEELIIGTEITVGVIGDQALPPVEIIPPEDEEFDYENKYNGKTQELCPAPSLTPRLSQAAEALAILVHQAVGCRHLSRTDIMITEDGDMYVLELNTMPGLTNQSLYPKAAAEAGITMTQLVERFIEMASRSLDKTP